MIIDRTKELESKKAQLEEFVSAHSSTKMSEEPESLHIGAFEEWMKKLLQPPDATICNVCEDKQKQLVLSCGHMLCQECNDNVNPPLFFGLQVSKVFLQKITKKK